MEASTCTSLVDSKGSNLGLGSPCSMTSGSAGSISPSIDTGQLFQPPRRSWLSIRNQNPPSEPNGPLRFLPLAVQTWLNATSSSAA